MLTSTCYRERFFFFAKDNILLNLQTIRAMVIAPRHTRISTLIIHLHVSNPFNVTESKVVNSLNLFTFIGFRSYVHCCKTALLIYRSVENRGHRPTSSNINSNFTSRLWLPTFFYTRHATTSARDFIER